MMEKRISSEHHRYSSLNHQVLVVPHGPMMCSVLWSEIVPPEFLLILGKIKQMEQLKCAEVTIAYL